MIAFVIYTAEGKTDRTFRCVDGHFGDELFNEVFDYLDRRFGADPELIAEAVSWCELATIGEEYESDEFTIAVEEV